METSREGGASARLQPFFGAVRINRKDPPVGKVVATSPTKWNVAWYGGGRREVAVVSGTGQWSKSGEGLVPLLWVFVHDLTGTHRDDDFFSHGSGDDAPRSDRKVHRSLVDRDLPPTLPPKETLVTGRLSRLGWRLRPC